MAMDYISKLKIKTSDTQEMKLVFTAQSKHEFYCRDVVCEYVMKQGFLPINPFRVFDYFLGDRVDRDLVRRGNNQLIRTCDELWVFGNIADGVLFEIVSAIEQDKPVRFFTIGSELNEIREISVDEITFEPQVHAAKIKKNDIINFIKTGNVKEDDDLSGQMTIFDVQRNTYKEQLSPFNEQYSFEKKKRKTKSDALPMVNYDVAVIGLGAAGMMTLNHLVDSSLKVIGIDHGNDPYKRTQETKDISNGFGGSGLFSDGKLSFYPSGSRMWSGLDYEKLKNAYGELKKDLQDVGCIIPPWNDEWRMKYIAKQDNYQKNYESIFFDRKQSDYLVKNTYDRLKNHVLLHTTVTRIVKEKQGYLLETTHPRETRICANKLVLATGKLGNQIVEHLLDYSDCKVRYEGGVRIETASENFLPYTKTQLDYKLIKKQSDGLEVRTFCCCRDGIVVKSTYNGMNNELEKKGFEIASFNGSVADFNSGRSNIGITIRTENEDNAFVKEFFKALKVNQSTNISLDEFDKLRNTGKCLVGIETDDIIRKYIDCIVKSDSVDYNTIIYWPEVEYFGKYPKFDWNTLRIPGNDIWVAGDVTGEFRGLIPAMVTGIYVANSIKQDVL